MTDPGSRDPYDFDTLSRIDRSTLPAPETLLARDGTPLAVRRYGDGTGTAVVALHGMFLDGSCFHPMAEALARRGAAVHVPDLRGHGASGGRRGDVDHVGQLDDDLADVLIQVRARHPGTRVVLLGHSSGGALVVRHGAGRRDHGIGGTVLLAPFLGGQARTTRQDPGGWVSADVARIADIARRTACGDGTGQDQVVLRFDPPASSPPGVVAQAYTYRMMASLAPGTDLGSDLSAIAEPLLVVAGARDGCFFAGQYEPTISPHAKGTFRVLPGLTHLGLLLSPVAWAAVEEWMRLPANASPGSPRTAR